MEGKNRYEKIHVSDKGHLNISLNIHHCGTRLCEESYTLVFPDFFTLCLVTEGEGDVTIGNLTESMHVGKGIFLAPEMKALLTPKGQGCRYYWVSFSGYLSESYLKRAFLTPKTPFFEQTEEFPLVEEFIRLEQCSLIQNNRYCKMMAILYAIISDLIDIARKKDWHLDENFGNDYYIQRALEYIDHNFGKKITIEDLAKQIGITRKYFYHVFREMMGSSPQDYIIEYRMGRACELIESGICSISDVAQSVGYSDPFHFSKTFKKIIGVSPTEFRKAVHKPEEEEENEKEYVHFLKQTIAKKDREIGRLKELLGIYNKDKLGQLNSWKESVITEQLGGLTDNESGPQHQPEEKI